MPLHDIEPLSSRFALLALQRQVSALPFQQALNLITVNDLRHRLTSR
jgi:hypothetical protein